MGRWMPAMGMGEVAVDDGKECGCVEVCEVGESGLDAFIVIS